LSQSSYIAAFLLIGFLVFITAKGQLPAYLTVIGLQGGQLKTTNTLTPINALGPLVFN